MSRVYKEVQKVTQNYLDRACLDYLLSPTLSELFNDYKFTGFTTKGDIKLNKKSDE